MNPGILGAFGLGGGELVLIVSFISVFALLGVGAIVGAYLLIRSLNGPGATPLPTPAERPHAASVASPESLPGTNLAGTRFRDGNLSGAEFQNVNLINARFHDVNLSNATFTAVNLGGATFKNIGPPPGEGGRQERQRPVRFEEMMLCDSIFRKVDLRDVRIVDCEMAGMSINGVPVAELLAAHERRTEPS